MLINRKMLTLYSALVAVAVLPGCQKLDDLFGVERTMPDNVNYAGGPRHAPLLNPDLGSAYNVDTAVPKKDSANTAPVLNPESGLYISRAEADAVSSGGGRHVPVENAAAESGGNSVNAAVVAAGGPDNNPMQAPTAQNAPVSPVSSNAYPSLAAVPQVPVHTGKEQSADEMKALNAQRASSESARQNLMGDQNATVMTSPQNGQMVDNPANAMPQPQAPVAPPPTVFTPPAPPPAAPAPQVTQATPSESGFNAWLHRNFSSDSKKDAGPANQPPAQSAGTTVPYAAPAPVMSAPASGEPAPPRDLMAGEPQPAAPAPENFSQPVPPEALSAPPSYMPAPPAPMAEAPPPPAPMAAQQPPIEPLPPAAAAPAPAQTVYAPPPAAAPMPEPMAPATPPAQASLQVPPSPTVMGQSDMEPVHLHPPGGMAMDDQPSAAPGPVTLTAPRAAAPGAVAGQTHYLADSRYAARRSQGGDDTGSY